MGIHIDLIVVIWFLVALLIVVGIVLFMQLYIFFKELSYSTKKFDVTLNKVNNLVDNCSKMSLELTEIARRANVNYKQLNKVVDNIGLGISNFVMSRFDNKYIGTRRRKKGGYIDEQR